jgi:hypothetical protein
MPTWRAAAVSEPALTTSANSAMRLYWSTKPRLIVKFSYTVLPNFAAYSNGCEEIRLEPSLPRSYT